MKRFVSTVRSRSLRQSARWASLPAGRRGGNTLAALLYRYRYMYLLLLPGVVYFLLFRYLPMFGIVIAFKNYYPTEGIRGFITAPWVGFKNFQTLFRSIYFKEIFANTVLISLYKILFGFPVPILLALLLNEVRSRPYLRVIQTVTYLPHFLSWVIIAGMMYELLSPTTGLVNDVVKSLGGKTIDFLSNPKTFRGLLVVSDIWKEMGWGSIVYLAAITSIDPALYDSAVIDGANRFRQIIHITLPLMMSTIVVILLLRVGRVLDADFEQVFMLYSPLTYKTGDIIDTFVYREGLVNARYGFATAVGLFKGAIGLVFILVLNRVTKSLGFGSLL